MGEQIKQEEVKEEAKPEEKKEEQAEEKKEEQTEEKKDVEKTEEKEEEPKPPSPFVLFVDLHCVGCAKKIERSLLKIRGVEGVVINMAQNQVTIKGVVEPQDVCDRITKKTKRTTQILSLLPEAEGEVKPQVVASQVSGLATLELNVNMHCKACAQQLKKRILKMKGVRTVETELSSGKVTVTGTMDADRLVDYVYRRTRKQAKIIPQLEPEKPAAEESKLEDKKEEKPAEEAKPEKKKEEGDKKEGEEKPLEEEKKEGGGENNEEKGGENKEEAKKGEENISDEVSMQKMIHYYQPLYYIERIPPPQLFSDENPNACCIV